MIYLNSYPYNSIIDFFNNNIVKINETIQKKNKKKSIEFFCRTMIPKERLLDQFNYWEHFDDGTPTIFIMENIHLKNIVSKSYSKCANNTEFETQYEGRRFGMVRKLP